VSLVIDGFQFGKSTYWIVAQILTMIGIGQAKKGSKNCLGSCVGKWVTVI